VPHIKIASLKKDVCKTCEDCKQDIKLAKSDNDKIEVTLKYHQPERKVTIRGIHGKVKSNVCKPGTTRPG
jgi:hypothetical protein